MASGRSSATIPATTIRASGPRGESCRAIRCRTGRRPNNHGGGTPDSDDYPVLGVNWDCGGRLLQLAEREDRQEVPAADRGRVGEGRARNRSAPLSVGQHDRSVVRELRRVRRPTIPAARPASSTAASAESFQTQSNASPYGALDMAGNVMEWCQDWYSRDYYAGSPRKNPEWPGDRRLPRGARRIVLRRGVRPARLRTIGRVAVVSRPPDDRVSRRARAVKPGTADLPARTQQQSPA